MELLVTDRCRSPPSRVGDVDFPAFPRGTQFQREANASVGAPWAQGLDWPHAASQRG
jgi:hypothetical protein